MDPFFSLFYVAWHYIAHFLENFFREDTPLYSTKSSIFPEKNSCTVGVTPFIECIRVMNDPQRKKEVQEQLNRITPTAKNPSIPKYKVNLFDNSKELIERIIE